MTQYTMIKPDRTVHIDGIGQGLVDYTGAKDFHAIQYNSETGKGHIEYGGDNDEGQKEDNKKISSAADIKTLSGITLDEFISRRATAYEASEAQLEADGFERGS